MLSGQRAQLRSIIYINRCFPKKKRLTHREFDEVFKNGTRIHSPLLTFISSAGLATDLEGKYAVVVSKKMVKSAVNRNRLRRQAYGALRTALSECLTSNPHLSLSGGIILLRLPKDKGDRQNYVKNIYANLNTELTKLLCREQMIHN